MHQNLHHVIITGGSSGIGKALALALQKKGANLTLIARDEKKLLEAKNEILNSTNHAPETKVLTLASDVSNNEAINSAIQKSIETMGPPDLLITSAGQVRPKKFKDAPLSDFEESMNTNYFGTLYTVKSVLPSMIQRQAGSIVMISSGAALAGVYGYSSYGPTKYALRGLAEVLYTELALENIHLSIVYPPDTETPQLEQEIKERPKGTSIVSGMHKPVSAEYVASCILKGLAKQKFEITPGLEMTALRKFNGVIGPFFRWQCLRALRRAKSLL